MAINPLSVSFLVGWKQQVAPQGLKGEGWGWWWGGGKGGGAADEPKNTNKCLI
jgi:hypothetical protein